MIVGFDAEWTGGKIDVLGLAYDEGTKATATARDDMSMQQCLDVMKRADAVVMQNGLSADCRQLAKECIDVSWLEPKVIDTRLLMHAVNGHLAGSGSYDLRSLALLAGSRRGYRFPLEFKQYATDLHRTCAMDAAAALWVYPTLQRQVTSLKLEPTVDIAHRCERIFARMKEQGIRLDKKVLEKIHAAKQAKTEEIIERYHLWEERGKKVVKRVPIWRSEKILDICKEQFGFKPKDRKRATWQKLLGTSLTPEAREFVEAIIELGQGANTSTFVGKAEEDEDGDLSFSKVSADGFIYPRYDICGSPDRAIASGPNIAQYPRPSDDPRIVKLRSAVIPLQDDHVLLGCDYSSLETITNAYEAGDMDRVTAVLEKRLTHEGTAELINKTFGLTLNRTQGKIVSHGLDKGESPFNLSRSLFKSERPSRQQVLQVQNIMNMMLASFPKLSKFRDDLWERSIENPLIVTNSFGRRLSCFSRSKYGDASERYARHEPSKRYWCSCSACSPRRDRFKYATAFLGRSCGFDALLRVMAKVWEQQILDNYSLPMIECHDELVYSVPKSKVERYAGLLKLAFEEPIPELGGLSLPANVVWGNTWAEAH